MDWGLALPTAQFGKSNNVPPVLGLGGTPAYMAPEMAIGPLERITFASDIYLLGAILYEIVTGSPAAPGRGCQAVPDLGRPEHHHAHAAEGRISGYRAAGTGDRTGRSLRRGP